MFVQTTMQSDNRDLLMLSHSMMGLDWASAVNGKWENGGVGRGDVTHHVDSGSARVKEPQPHFQFSDISTT